MLTLTLGMTALAGAAYETIPFDASVVTGKLSNGLTYYVKKNNTPEHHADFFIAQKVGSVQEEENQRGLAHFLEHMCFNGTKHFPGNSLINYLESIGVKFGANLNAYTSTDETVYNISNVPTNRQSALDSCFLVLSDWSHALLLKNKDIDAERGVIEGEWRMRSGAYNRMLEKAAPILYPGSIYGHRMPIGLMSVVKNFKYKELKNYYKKWYHPSNQAIIVVGDIDTDYAVAKIKELFGNIKNPKTIAPVVSVPVPDNEELIVTVQTDNEQTVSNVRVMFKHDDIAADEMRTTKYMENDYLKSVVSSMLTARFADLKLEPDAPFTHVSVMDRKYMISKTKQALQFMGISKPGQVDQCVQWISRELKRATRFGFTESEYMRARLKFEASLDKLYRERDKYSNTKYARSLVRVFEDGEPCADIETYCNMMLKVIAGINVEHVNRYLNSIVSPTDRNVVLAAFCSNKAPLPTEQSLIEAFHAGRNEQVTAYVDSVQSNELLLTEPQSGKIVSETDIPQFDAKLLTLSNGIKVYLKKTELNNNEIVLAGNSPGGLSQSYTIQNAPSYKAFNSIMALSGYGQFSSNDLKKVLAGKNVTMRTFVSKTEEGFQGSTTPQDAETAFKLLYLKLTSPQKDQKAFNNYLDNNRTRLEHQNADPKYEFADSIFATVFQKHPLGGENLSKEDIDKVDYNTILNCYKDRFSDMGDMNVYIVGNFDDDSIRTYIKKYIASLPSSGRIEKPKDINYRLFGTNIERHWTRKMENPQDKNYFFWTANSDYDLKHVLIAKITGQIMQSIFMKEIREERGWTYHVDSHCSVVTDQNGDDAPVIFMPLNVTVKQGKAQETHDLIEQLMREVAQKGVKEEQLKKVKEYVKKVYTEDREDNSYWMVMLRTFAKHQLNFDKDYLNILDSITTNDIQQFVDHLLTHGHKLKLIMTAE